MSHLKVILPAAIVLGGILVCTTASYGTADIAKKTTQKCVYCHTDVKNAKDLKTLTDAGKYYHEHKSLDGYKAADKK
ncbi:MAG: hypothetical protein LAQ69_00235 [Acidobacteriia bacterium]|nr:hypothetical protein [Terriglobia bacterium]